MKVTSSVRDHRVLPHPRKTFNFFLYFFFFINRYDQTHSAGRHYSGPPDFYMLSRLCNIRSNIIVQGFVPCGSKMQHTSGSAGAELEPPVSTVASGESRDWQEQAELLACGPPAQLSDTRVCLGQLGIFWL